MVAETSAKITQRPLIRPIEADAYYSIAEITNRTSPWYIASAATIFRALRNGSLIPNYIGRRVLLSGASIHTWLRGEGEGVR